MRSNQSQIQREQICQQQKGEEFSCQIMEISLGVRNSILVNSWETHLQLKHCSMQMPWKVSNLLVPTLTGPSISLTYLFFRLVLLLSFKLSKTRECWSLALRGRLGTIFHWSMFAVPLNYGGHSCIVFSGCASWSSYIIRIL